MDVNRSPSNAGSTDTQVGFRPLYRQVAEVLTSRIAEGLWKAGEAIPSEIEIAADLRTSQGTVRKALDEMEAARLVVRRQGRGTFVALHDDARILFQFFRLVADGGGAASFPESCVLSVERARADAAEAAHLALARGVAVVRLTRERSLAGRVAIFERVTLPANPFGPIADGPVPNNLYELYASHFGVAVASARERLKATAARPEAALRLGLPAGTPVLSIDRISAALDGRPVEWRRSLCRTDDLHYFADLR